MRIYLVQHGEAKAKDEDPDRHLTAKGQDDVRKVAEFLASLGLRLRAIIHSGKTRAEETALLLHEGVKDVAGVVRRDGLSPKDDPRPVLEELEAEGEDVFLVGHQPFMGRMAGLMVAGDEKASPIAFRKGGVVCLEKDEEEGWQVLWSVIPDILTRRRSE